MDEKYIPVVKEVARDGELLGEFLLGIALTLIHDNKIDKFNQEAESVFTENHLLKTKFSFKITEVGKGRI